MFVRFSRGGAAAVLVSAATVVCLGAVAPPVEADGSVAASAPVEDALFGPEETLVLRLEAPWSELTRSPQSGDERQGVLSYGSGGGERVDIPLRVVVRGKTRLEVCTAPGLTLELDATRVGGTPFADNPVVHLTAQCGVHPRFAQYLALEHLAYRAYALVADVALGSRWVEVEYAEPGKQRAPAARPAFLVEDISLAATRTGRVWLRPQSSRPEALDASAGAIFVLFQYLIGNTDWSALVGPVAEPCCHNVALFGPPGAASGLVPVPFDLDSAGLVGADYVVPDPRLGLRSTRQRLYRGPCFLNDHLPGAIARFTERRVALEGLVERAAALSERSRAATLSYLREFFATVGDPAQRSAGLLRACR